MNTPMYAFEKRVRKADEIRHFTIRPIDEGWEVREEQNSRLVRQMHYRDWHRVERARRALVQQLSTLRENGWQEVA